MTRMNRSVRAHAMRVSGAVGAGALVLGMVTVGAAVAADSGENQVVSHLKAPQKTREMSVDLKAPKRTREASVELKAPKRTREASVELKAPKRTREASVVLKTAKRTREALPTA